MLCLLVALLLVYLLSGKNENIHLASPSGSTYNYNLAVEIQFYF